MRTLIVDGYNIIHAWVPLKATLQHRGLEDARRQLISALAGYAAQTGVEVCVVFDAHARRTGAPTAEVVDGVTVRFGTRSASADHVIERAAYLASRSGEETDVVVATDDRLQRALVGAMGVGTMGALALEEEVARAAGDMEGTTRRMQAASRSAARVEDRLDPEVRRRLEQLRRGEEPGGTVSSDD